MGVKKMPPQIIATRVADIDRTPFLKAHFGEDILTRQRRVRRIYTWLDILSPGVRGCQWHLYSLSNSGFYMAPSWGVPLCLKVPKRDIFAVLSADAAGIVATMFALNDYSTILANPDDINGMIERYHHLGAFATMHNEAHMLYQVIEHIG
ncbi:MULTISPECIES: antirestriction protein [Xanthomonas]|uniref:antirestriction protein n=2 Tax=Xanthomonas TaxID=338 RepID=UPI001C468D26|nr:MULTISPECIES: antirestriction protein [Xanthomonas]MBV6843550.1 antirestriction protein [Xanthomonas campestris pv. fici]